MSARKLQAKWLLPIPRLPARDPLRSPEVVRLFDVIRRDLQQHESFAEFNWFAREYPRYYRHHLDCASFRVRSIHRRYELAHAWFMKHVEGGAKWLEMTLGNEASIANYWDFESMLYALGSALDLLARIVGTAYTAQLPPSFSKLCRRADLSGPVATLRRAKIAWVDRMKDYRDCFVHYTPVDTILSVRATRYPDGVEVGSKLPVNPNARESLDFRYRRRPELFRYAIYLMSRMWALDRRIARELRVLYATGEYPKRFEGLHGVGRRHRDRHASKGG